MLSLPVDIVRLIKNKASLQILRKDRPLDAAVSRHYPANEQGSLCVERCPVLICLAPTPHARKRPSLDARRSKTPRRPISTASRLADLRLENLSVVILRKGAQAQDGSVFDVKQRIVEGVCIVSLAFSR